MFHYDPCNLLVKGEGWFRDSIEEDGDLLFIDVSLVVDDQVLEYEFRVHLLFILFDFDHQGFFEFGRLIDLFILHIPEEVD